MRYVNKVLAALLILAVGYLAYGIIEIRRGLFMVYDVPDQYAYAPADSDLIIVDFNKYDCANCRILHSVLMEAIRQDGKVRYVSRSVTYSNEWEETLITAVYAAGEQGKFIALHDVINAEWPINNRRSLFRHAKEIGLDTKQLSRDMMKTEILEHALQNKEFFEAWRLGRMPAFLIGEKAIYMPKTTDVTVEDFLAKFKDARS